MNPFALQPASSDPLPCPAGSPSNRAAADADSVESVSNATDGTVLARRGSRMSQLLYRGMKAVALCIWRPVTLCRILGVPLQIHLTWLLYPAGFFLWLAHLSGREGVCLQVLAFLGLLEASIVIHELAHVWVARWLGIETHRIVLIPLGGVALIKDSLEPPKELWIALAGPVASLALAGLFYLASLPASDPGPFWRFSWLRILQGGMILNLYIGLFNLIPCFPLDGGRILRSSLYWVIRRLRSIGTQRANLLATRITVRYVGWPLVGGLITWMILAPQTWPYFIWFPPALVFAELEYRMLRDEESEDRPVDPLVTDR